MKGSKLSSNNMIVDNFDDDISDNESLNDTNLDKYTNSDFEKQCDLLVKQLTNNYRQQREDIRNLVRLHRKEMKKMNKKQKSIKEKEKKKKGFRKPTVVPDKLADYVGIERGKIMCRTELTGLICDKFKKDGLYLKNDKRIIIPDKEVMELFNLPESAKKSNDPKDPNGLNFYTLQTHIAKCYKDVENNQTENKSIDTSKHINKLNENKKTTQNVLNMAK